MKSLFSSKIGIGYIIAALTVFLAGCVASNVLVDQKYSAGELDKFTYEVETKVEVPTAEQAMIRSMLEAQLRASGLYSDHANNHIVVSVTKYRFRTDATRILTGNLTGTDAIVSTITIERLSDGERLGREEVITQNPTVVSKSQDLISAHVKKIVQSIRN